MNNGIDPVAYDAWKLETPPWHDCDEEDEEDPTPWCLACGAMLSKNCHCGPYADNN